MKLTILDNSYKEQTWERLKAVRDAAEYGGFTYNGAVFDSDETSVRRITGAVTLAMIAQSTGEPYSETWILADNSTMQLDAQGVIGLGVAMGAHVKALFARSVAARIEVEAATTKAQLDAIVW